MPPNIKTSSTYNLNGESMLGDKSFMNSRNKRGPSTEPFCHPRRQTKLVIDNNLLATVGKIFLNPIQRCDLVWQNRSYRPFLKHREMTVLKIQCVVTRQWLKLHLRYRSHTTLHPLTLLGKGVWHLFCSLVYIPECASWYLQAKQVPHLFWAIIKPQVVQANATLRVICTIPNFHMFHTNSLPSR